MFVSTPTCIPLDPTMSPQPTISTSPTFNPTVSHRPTVSSRPTIDWSNFFPPTDRMKIHSPTIDNSDLLKKKKDEESKEIE